MKVIPISGKAGHGKDTLAGYMKAALESQGKQVLITHYGDLLKYICKQFFDWNGEKDEKGRTLLQHVGTEVVRAKRPDYWVDFVREFLLLFQDEWDYVLIPDTRFPNEIVKLAPLKVIDIRINRPGFNMLTKEQQKHISETALDDWDLFYFTVENDGTLQDLAGKAAELCLQLEVYS